VPETDRCSRRQWRNSASSVKFSMKILLFDQSMMRFAVLLVGFFVMAMASNYVVIEIFGHSNHTAPLVTISIKSGRWLKVDAFMAMSTCNSTHTETHSCFMGACEVKYAQTGMQSDLFNERVSCTDSPAIPNDSHVARIYETNGCSGEVMITTMFKAGCITSTRHGLSASIHCDINGCDLRRHKSMSEMFTFIVDDCTSSIIGTETLPFGCSTMTGFHVLLSPPIQDNQSTSNQ
jgi:hypothetical protein